MALQWSVVSGQWSVVSKIPIRFYDRFSNSFRGRSSFYTELQLLLSRKLATDHHWPLATKQLMPNNNPIAAYVSLGSNLGDRAGNLLLGIRGMLDAGHEVTRLSQIYETEPVETFAQPIFLNMVAELRVEARLKPEELLEQFLGVEQLLGRTRDSIKGPRTIDLDLLLYGEELVNNQRLTLPHPHLHRRRFVLVPLTELCPNLEHPVIHRTIAELLRETTDRSKVKPWVP